LLSAKLALLTAWGRHAFSIRSFICVYSVADRHSSAHAEKRVALVIGNSAYKNAARLQNPKNDATDVADALKRLGFETIVGLDLDKAGMEEKTIAFTRAARDADVITAGTRCSLVVATISCRWMPPFTKRRKSA
jgi:Caspase domain